MNVRFLKNKKVFASPVILYIISELGVDAISYEPETIAEFLKAKEPAIDKQVIDRTNAALGLFTSNLFWTDPAIFNIVSRALNRNRFPTRNAASIEDMAWGMTEASLLLSGSEDDTVDSYSDSVNRYVKFALKSEGLYTVPECMSQIGSIPFNTQLDDAEMMLSVQQRSDSRAADIDLYVSNQMMELLNQISISGVAIDKEAKIELNKLLTNTKKVIS